MSKDIKIKNGLDIKLVGKAENKVSDHSSADFAIKPPDFTGVFPKLFVKPGDTIKAGTPLFFDKYRDNIVFSSPVSGKVVEVRRGAKRKMLEVRIESDGKQDYVDFGKADPGKLSKDEVTEKLLKSGVWANIRQRPYSVIANPGHNPKAIFISAFDSAPLAIDMDFVLDKEASAFQAGIDALKKLTDGKIHLNIKAGQTKSAAFLNAKNVEINSFSGKHPAGNVGVQIHHIDPINKGDVVWYVHPQAVVAIGKLFQEGKYDANRIVALAGSEVKNPQYYKVLAGISLNGLFNGKTTDGDLRYISGNVLSGTSVGKDGYLGFYDYQLSVIPEGNYHEFLGWAMPRFKNFSFSKSFFSWLTPNKEYRLDTNLNGGHRAFVLTGEYEKVFPFDIYPMQLLKAIMVKDIDKMENLGIYEVDEEDFALCEFIDVSKTEMQSIVREGLDFIRKEME
ncbi:MAG: Na(+)-translocating NADH-quinone reductase subunit A [Chlorobi bacterium]|nr:Na(+)-translocating NADH-quinone reductase subunit A [Chlorobiota bacterium]